MDFGTLLQTAKQNEGYKKEVRSYSTKFAPPKKEEKKDKVLSANIQKFLARKESEERRKAIEANRKRDELLALRAKDKKATNRVNVMLKRTKSANQSVIQDAVDNDNTAVTLVGPAQPDEDDYGYVSQEASAFYNKMMEKYNKMPDEEKFPTTKKKASSNLSSTKDRVKAALEKEQLEAMMPHRRKRKHKEGEEEHDDNHEDHQEPEEKSEPPPKVKPKIKGPPPINFNELLKLASQKQHEPIMIEVKPKEEGPLFTKKQKQELEKEQQRRVGNEAGKLTTDQINEIRKLPPSYLSKTKKRREVSRSEVNETNYDSDYNDVGDSSNQIPKPQSSISKKPVPNDKIVKGSQDLQTPDRIPKKQNELDSRPSKIFPEKTQYSKIPNDARLSKPYPEKTDSRLAKSYPSSEVRLPKSNNDVRPLKSHFEKPTSNAQISKPETGKALNPKVLNNQHSSKPLGNKQPVDNGLSKVFDKPQSTNSSKNFGINDNRLKPNNTQPPIKPKIPITSQKQPGLTKQQPQSSIAPKTHINERQPLDRNKIQGQRKQFPPNDVRPKQAPSNDLKSKQLPPPDVMRRKEFSRPKPQIGNKRRILDDDDEEYDSEMDDFIDDGPEENNDYSSYIREIFGYDKRKYRVIDDEDDVDNMESTFAQQMREDVRSTKIAIMEDLEDMKKEREEKRIKALKKKGRL